MIDIPDGCFCFCFVGTKREDTGYIGCRMLTKPTRERDEICCVKFAFLTWTAETETATATTAAVEAVALSLIEYFVQALQKY